MLGSTIPRPRRGIAHGRPRRHARRRRGRRGRCRARHPRRGRTGHPRPGDRDRRSRRGRGVDPGHPGQAGGPGRGGGRGRRLRPHPDPRGAPRAPGGQGGAAAADRVHLLELLPGQAPEPAEGQGEDALPGLRLSPSRLRLPAALLIAAVSGALLSISLPPVGFWPVVFVAPIPLLWLVRGSRPGRAALCGFVFGFAYFGALLYWILLFGELGWAALVIMSAGFTAAFGALAPAVWRRDHPLLGTLGLASLWTVIEWIRGMIPLGGFGWGQLGVTQVDAPALPLASVGGVWALSFSVVVVAGLLLLSWERWGSGRRARALALAISAVAVAVVPAAIPLPAPNGRSVEVAAIQVDVASVQDLVGADEDVAVARLNIDRHLELTRDPPDLVVWGEGALDPGVTADPLLMSAVSQAIASVGAPTIAGAVTDDPDGTERTVTLAFDGAGRIVDRYVKVKLVPFGEYVPFRKQLGWISATDQVPVDRAPGDDVSLISIPALP